MKLCIFGGVGSGKSVALNYLRDSYRAEIIGMDETAHQLYETGRAGWNEVVDLLGPSVLREDQSLDRKKMADILYRKPELMDELNRRIHPLVYAEVDRRLRTSPAEVVVVETALPRRETGALYEEKWYVYTPYGIRVERLMRDRGYSEERCREIMARQPGEEVYRELADWVLVNDGSPADLKAQIDSRLSGKAKKY